MSSLYDVLEIPTSASEAEIKRAYYKLVRVYVPEKHPDKFKELRKAYTTLSDKEQRKTYDMNFSVPEKYQDLFFTAKNMLDAHNIKAALKILGKLSKNSPDSVQINLLLAEAYTQNGNTGKAIKMFEKLSGENPDNQIYALHLANSYYLRGFNTKANDQYKKALEIDKTNASAWVDYINFLRNYLDGNILDAVEKAEDVSPDIFKNNYQIYVLACGNCMNIIRFNIDTLRHMYNKFVEFFIADESINKSNSYKNALKMTMDLCSFPECYDIILKIMPALEAHAIKTKEEEEDFKDLKYKVEFLHFDNDDDIDETLKELTHLLFIDDDSPERESAILYTEFYILMNIRQLRKSIRLLQEKYPEYYKLNQQFYLNMMNPKKHNNLKDYYFKETRAAIKKKPHLFDEPSVEDYLEIFEDLLPMEDFEMEQPFVRESPKVGRNDPCPCGSGKKYKKCCGA